MDFLKYVGISDEDLNKISEQVSDEVIKFFPWSSFVVTERGMEVAVDIIKSKIQKKVWEIFGKPLPSMRMRSPRAAKKS